MEFLPALIVNGRTLAENKTGSKWTSVDFENVGKLSNDILVDSIEDSVEISSIPDIWERAILFENALLNTEHKLHRRIFGEWMALLALIAFSSSGIYKGKLNFISFDLTSDEVIKGTNDQNFISTLNKNLPHRYLNANLSWTKGTIITFNTFPIAMTSPTTLFFTAKDCKDKLNEIRWCENGRYLIDPISSLNSDRKRDFKKWLRILTEERGLISLGEHPFINKLIELLNIYLKRQEFQIIENLDNIELQTINNLPNILTPLIKRINISTCDSNVQLINSPSKKQIFVIHKELPEQWGKDPNEIHVFEGINYNDLYTKNVSPDGKKIGNILVPFNTEAINPYDFFNDKLYVLPKGNLDEKEIQFLAQTQNIEDNRDLEVEIIIPLKKRILDYCNFDSINEILNVRKNGDDFIFELTLKVNGFSPNDTAKEFRIEKKYNSFTQITSPPQISIWPKIKIKNYNTYFISNYNVEVNNTFNIKPVNFSSENHKTFGAINLYKTSELPKALVCFSGNEEIGLLFYNQPEFINLIKEEIHMAVDFGTSSTQVFYKKLSETNNDKAIVEMVIKDQSINITKNVKSLSGYLVPSLINFPILSFYKKRKENEAEKWFEDGFIYYDTTYKGSPNEAGNLESIIDDLKWSEKKEERVLYQMFLEQLLINTFITIILEEKAIPNKIIYSFPLSFSEPQEKELEKKWESILKTVKTIFQLGDENLQIEKKNESFSSGCFFTSTNDTRLKSNLQDGIIVIDIGGGSTDISIWQTMQNQHSLIHQSSIKFAGNDILIKYLEQENFKEFTKKLFQITNDSIVDKKSINMQFKNLNFASDIMTKISNERGEGKGKELTSLIEFNLSSIFYYVGTLINILIEKNKFTLQDNSLPSIYLAGSGSNILKWLLSYNLLEKSFLKGLGKEINENINLKINLTSKPKSEVAIGLLSNTVGLIETGADNSVYSGISNGETIKKGSTVDIEFLKTKKLTLKGSNPLQEFLSLFNKDEPFLKIDFSEVIKQVNTELTTLNNTITQENKDLHIEPLFFKIFKQYIALLNSN